MKITKKDINKTVAISTEDPAFQTGMETGKIVAVEARFGTNWVCVRVGKEFGLHDCGVGTDNRDCLWLFEEYVSLEGGQSS